MLRVRNRITVYGARSMGTSGYLSSGQTNQSWANYATESAHFVVLRPGEVVLSVRSTSVQKQAVLSNFIAKIGRLGCWGCGTCFRFSSPPPVESGEKERHTHTKAREIYTRLFFPNPSQDNSLIESLFDMDE